MTTPVAVQTDSSTAPNTELTFPVTGMTCASCVRRIEKALNRVEGVQGASVNLATEKAKVSFGDGVSTEDLIATVEKTGYTAALPRPPAPAGSHPHPGGPTRGIGAGDPAAAAANHGLHARARNARFGDGIV